MTQGAFVADRILETFLDAGLLELGGNDAWFEHISAAADKLAVHIGAHPEQLAAFVYSAVDPRERLGVSRDHPRRGNTERKARRSNSARRYTPTIECSATHVAWGRSRGLAENSL